MLGITVRPRIVPLTVDGSCAGRVRLRPSGYVAPVGGRPVPPDAATQFGGEGLAP